MELECIIRTCLAWVNAAGLVPLIHPLPFKDSDKEALRQLLFFQIFRNQSWLYSNCNPCPCEARTTKRCKSDEYSDTEQFVDMVELPPELARAPPPTSVPYDPVFLFHPTTELWEEAVPRLQTSISALFENPKMSRDSQTEGAALFLCQPGAEGRFIAGSIVEYLEGGESVLHVVFGPREFSAISGCHARATTNSDVAFRSSISRLTSTVEEFYFVLLMLTFAWTFKSQLLRTAASKKAGKIMLHMTIWEKDTCYMPNHVWRLLADVFRASRHFEPHSSRAVPWDLLHRDDLNSEEVSETADPQFGFDLKYTERVCECCCAFEMYQKTRKCKVVKTRVEGHYFNYVERFMMLSCLRLQKVAETILEVAHSDHKHEKDVKLETSLLPPPAKFSEWLMNFRPPVSPLNADWMSLAPA